MTATRRARSAALLSVFDVTEVVRLSDSSIVAQHGDPWYGMAVFSKVYVPRYENGSLSYVDVFPLQCE